MADVVPAPLFSIIVPTLNVASVVESCLGSIAAQTFVDFAIVVVDGGSVDETLATNASPVAVRL